MRQKVNFPKNTHEFSAWQAQETVCGVDEVGRGCLAGPLVTAAVILHPHKTHRLLKDSKILTEAERLKAAAWIVKNAWYSYGIVHHRAIDQYNIWHATLMAMKKSVVNLLTICPQRPQAILVDAMPLNLANTNFDTIPVHYFCKGESLSSSIAAASILAKVKRDHMMTALSPSIPDYLLEKHKGYATASHQNAIRSLDRSIIHRQSFMKSLTDSNHIPDTAHENQQTIC